ncbi:uncharacterized protein LOC129612082 [Condylostylus longicornis]|uniref:uncharacterized protein LOC129612082 n=1 Tax=Condylostylus longicornis TaxID=2530218 RepID=UPI00244E2F28|nr:uncharacterized protein LOC129612082 [Condylostylus longicornis]
MKFFLIIFIISFMFFIDTNAHGKIIFPRELSFNINDPCEEDGYKGTIRRFVNCELAIAFLKEVNIYPKIYYFDKFEPIICCIQNDPIYNKINDESKIEYQNSLDGSIFTINQNKKTDSQKQITTEKSELEEPSYFQLEQITCTTEEQQGILSQFKDCPTAISKFKNQAIRPEIFTFKGLQPVICCIK